jgi:hypothetical protein
LIGVLIARTRLLLATLWAGSLWSIGYLAAPILFATISDKMLAGTIAGSLFTAQAWLSIFCAVTLIGLTSWSRRELDAGQYRILISTILAMLGCALILYFWLHPLIAGLRNGVNVGGLMAADIKHRFAILHSFSSGIYLVQSLLAVVLVIKIR